jgi:DNA polymerase elongation subunit (family B)
VKFYTNFYRQKDKVLIRGWENGERIQVKDHPKPTLYTPRQASSSAGEFKTLAGETVHPIQFESVWKANDFVKQYKAVDGFKFYGSTAWDYAHINETYPGVIDYDPARINIVYLDIETDSSTGFPDIAKADKAITAITLRKGKKRFVFGYRPYTTKENEFYCLCKDEAELLTMFLQTWEMLDPDVITGWNIDFFDIPYLVVRIMGVLGETAAKKLSPWRILTTRETVIRGKTLTVHTPVGITSLDYMRLYQKFSFTGSESWALAYIAEKDLNVSKIDYSKEYGTLADLYAKNHQLFIEYNIRDVDLIYMLEEKHKFIELVFAVSYVAKVNFEDAFGTVKSWDAIIHNLLLDKKIVVPYFEPEALNFSIEGGYVKDPVPGKYKHVVSLDIVSEYPHCIMQYNISPETYRGKIPKQYSMEQILDGAYNELTDFLKKNNYCVTPNGCVYTREFQGFLPQLMEEFFKRRAAYRKIMGDAKKEAAKNPSEELSKTITKYHNLQLATKIQINAAYGALANVYFRWFSVPNAEAIPASGRLCIRWAERYINKYLNDLLGTNEDYVIAIDTDSMYIVTDRLVSKVFSNRGTPPPIEEITKFLDAVCKDKFEPLLEKAYNDLAEYSNAFAPKIKMKRENLSSIGIWTKKKRYVMLVEDEEGVPQNPPKLKIVGMEAVRSSTPKLCRDSLKKALRIMVTDSKAALDSFLADFKAKYFTLPWEEVASPRGLSGMIEYADTSVSIFGTKAIYKEKTPIQTRGALLYNYHIKDRGLENRYQALADGDKVKFCYLTLPNPIRENVIASPGPLPPELELDKYIDYETQWQKTFLEPLRPFAEAMGWDLDNKATLETFFR